jgi:UDP:flavonoid glycosyltransferase YjiC (YdhE family)
MAARVAQETHGVPLATVHLQPSMFPSLYDTPRYPGMPLPRWLPRFFKRWVLHGVAYRGVIDWVLGRPLNAWRAELGLPPAKGVMLDWVNSPQLVIGLFPEWFGPPQPDWPGQVRLTGFPLYDEREQQALSPEVERFLDEGDAPVAFTPGSAMWQGHSFFAASAGACRVLKRRGILLSRHRDHIPRDLPPGVIHVDYAPFSQLLPKCAALVHHGGIGTTAQALAAGVPQLVMPLAHDQFDSAERVRRLGVGSSVPVKRYKAPRVAKELEELLESPRVREQCRAVAAKFDGVDPLGETCDLIEGLAEARAKDNESRQRAALVPSPGTPGEG